MRSLIAPFVAAAALALGSMAFYGCSDNSHSPADTGRSNSGSMDNPNGQNPNRYDSGASGTVNPDQSTGDYNNAQRNRTQQDNMYKNRGSQNNPNGPNTGSDTNNGANSGSNNSGTTGSGSGTTGGGGGSTGGGATGGGGDGM
jgi:hypothetical protein